MSQSEPPGVLRDRRAASLLADVGTLQPARALEAPDARLLGLGRECSRKLERSRKLGPASEELRREI